MTKSNYLETFKKCAGSLHDISDDFFFFFNQKMFKKSIYIKNDSSGK